MTAADAPPAGDEIELTLFGPGYGESIALHVGGGAWVLVDSCLDKDGAPRSLRYLESLGLDPARAVVLVVATHWHDDHIRGMAQLVETCGEADFCCAAVLGCREFLSAVAALEARPFSDARSGVQELYRVFSRRDGTASRPIFALANQRILKRGECEIWSLSPDSAVFEDFLRSIGRWAPVVRQTKTRFPDPSPNEAAVALWVEVGDVALLLGADLERRGWTSILQSGARPSGLASVLKAPHHGSGNAHEPGVWTHMLTSDPFAVLTPWRRGDRALPSPCDVQRILSCTRNAYATAKTDSLQAGSARRGQTVERTIRESGIRLRRLPMSPGWLRLRRPLDLRTPWTVETFEPACHLEKFAA